MKRVLLFACAALTLQINAQITVVDFEDLTLSPQSYWNGSDGSGDFTSAGLTFSNVYNQGWAYWESGFAFSNQVSDTMTGTNGMYSSYADGGVGGSGIYVISQNNTELVFDQGFYATSISLTNNNYAAHSMLDGDQFAKKFGGTTGDDQDWFLLTIRGYATSADANPTDSVLFYLADYRFADNNQDYIVKDWTSVQLTALAGMQKLGFELSSSDMGTWGMNTPAFFAIDNITGEGWSAVTENTFEVQLYPNPTTQTIFLKNLTSATQYSIYSIDGKVVASGKVTGNSINVESLLSGYYHLSLNTNGQQSITRFQKL